MYGGFFESVFIFRIVSICVASGRVESYAFDSATATLKTPTTASYGSKSSIQTAASCCQSMNAEDFFGGGLYVF